MIIPFAPQLNQSTNQTDFLPESAESTKAAQLVEERFSTVSTDIPSIIVAQTKNMQKFSDRERQILKKLEVKIKLSKDIPIKNIISVFSLPEAKEEFESPSENTMTMIVNLSLGSFNDFETIPDEVKKITREMTLEDLRRSFSMRADALGISSDIQDKLMGHTVKGTKAKYQKGITTTALKAVNVEDAIKLTSEDLFKQLGYTSPEDVVSFTEGKYRVRVGAQPTVGQQVQEITQPKVTQPIIEQKPIVEQKPIIEQRVGDVEIETKAKKSVSGKNYTELPKTNNKKIALALEKAGKTGKLATILKFGLKAGIVLAPLEPLQLLNQIAGGEEGLYKKKLFGVFEPTISKEVEAWKELGTQVKGLFGQDQQDVI